MQKKGSKRTWAEHYLYMVAVNDARGDADSLYLDNINHHASPELMNVIHAKYDPARIDYLRHAEELAHFLQSIELGSDYVDPCTIGFSPSWTRAKPFLSSVP